MEKENNNRRSSRITIMEKLYSYDLTGEFQIINPDDFEDEYVAKIINYYCTNSEEVDNLITSSLLNYTIGRLSYVDRAIMRMAVVELLTGMPKTVAINEALEICKIYSDKGDKSNVRLMNKVLDTISKKIETK